MELNYTKMQGLGNDFIILDNRKNILSDEQLKKVSKRLCSRRISVGADGLMSIEESNIADFKMSFYNSDGSIGEMCGNGARCIIRYAYINSIAKKKMSIETTAGIVTGEVIEERKVSVKLNKPTYINLDIDYKYENIDYKISYVELGNPPLPHCMIEYRGLNKIEYDDILDIGKTLRYWEKFPKGANVNFYEVLSDNSILVKTYERGVEGFTLACGTGSASTALIAYIKDLVKEDLIHIKVQGGDLEVKVIKADQDWDLYLIGDTNIVSKGIILDEELKIGDD